MSDLCNTNLNCRIKELEEKIDQLRFSRRVLMNLVERLEKEKWENMSRLERDKKRLQLQNSKYARILWHKNRQILDLETKLGKNSLKNIT